MAIPQLSAEQIRTWTWSQKDEWWFKNVFRGDMPQLTIRSALTGFVLGGVLAATAPYIAAKTGISIGVGLTSVILAFAMYRILDLAGIATDFAILENNCTQSIATAAGYMVGPLISSLAAYMMVTGKIIPWPHMLAWMCVVAILGVLIAFPMKRRFINEEQLPFPEGRASGVVLDALYTGAASEGMYKARLLAFTALFTGLYQAVISDGWMKLLQFRIVRMNQWAGMKEPWTFHDRLDSYYYTAVGKANAYIPTILGTDIRVLGLRLTLDAAMLGQWSLWWGVTMMVVGSLMSLFGHPEIFKGLFKRRAKDDAADVPKHIEFPLWISAVGIPVFGVLVDDGLRQLRVSGGAAMERRCRTDCQGHQRTPHSAVVSMIVAAVVAAAMEVARIVTKGRFALSAVSIGLGVVLPPESTLGMWVGAMIFWAMRLRYSVQGTRGHRFWVEGMEPICAGLISGSALMGIGNAIVNVLIG